MAIVQFAQLIPINRSFKKVIKGRKTQYHIIHNKTYFYFLFTNIFLSKKTTFLVNNCKILKNLITFRFTYFDFCVINFKEKLCMCIFAIN